MPHQNASSPTPSIRDALRFHTRDIHEQLHEHSHFVALFQGYITSSQYRALMTAFHGFYAPMENAIEQTLKHTQGSKTTMSYPARTGLLAQDLADLGLTAAEIAHNPQCRQMHDIVTPASLAGVLYVIEGSTLGAALIDRAAQKVLEDDSPKGRSFWAWSRANNKARWAAMNAQLDQINQDAQPQDAIIKGACETFQALATWLAPLEAPSLHVERAAS